MSSDAATKRRGRPRVTAPDLSAADKASQWLADLKRSGGHRLQVNFNASAWQVLKKMAGPRERGPFLERLVLAEHARRIREKKG